MDDRKNFETWFVGPLERLYPEVEQFGFIIVMVTLPLLERYLRQKKNLGTEGYNKKFFGALEELFPDLLGQTETFWKPCRNGLLHRGTFNGPGIRLVRDMNRPIEVNRDDPANIVFHLDPVAFAQKVLATITGDFEVYATSLTSPLPAVFQLNEIQGNSSSVPLWGTGLPPKEERIFNAGSLVITLA
jgi:hypothetical protein